MSVLPRNFLLQSGRHDDGMEVTARALNNRTTWGSAEPGVLSRHDCKGQHDIVTPEKSSCSPPTGARNHRHRLPRACEIRAKDILGGLHHEYRQEQRVA